MRNIRILRYSTGEWLEGSESIGAIKDIVNNNSEDYSYSKKTALQTIKHFNIKL